MRTVPAIIILVIGSLFSLKAQNNQTRAYDSHQLPFDNIQIGLPEVQPEVFELLDLNREGLEKVKSLHDAGNYQGAAQALLDYYKNRTSVNHPDINLQNIRISEQEQKWADDGLEHVFFSHRGYQPSFFYGDDVEWELWPVKDNELRWQRHRHKWWSPMGKAYRVSGDEKYAEEWKFQYLDWIEKNPLVKLDGRDRESLSPEELKKLENSRFAWRPLEVSNRLQDQI